MPNPITFPGLGLSFTIDRVAFTIGSKPVYWYGIIICIGFLLGAAYACRIARRYGLTSEQIQDMLLFALPLSIIGARLYYVIFYFDLYKNPDGSVNWGDVIAIWDGGLAIYGGIIAAVLTVIVFCKVKKLSVWAMLDVGGFGLLIGQAIGRWGNFCNQEAYGGPTSLPWRMGLIAGGELIEVHPTFLYECLWNVVGLILLIFLSRKRKFDGQMFLSYVAWYGLGRMWIEGLRTDSLYFFGLTIGGTPIRTSQALAFLSLLAAIILLGWKLKFQPNRPEDLYVNQVTLPEPKKKGKKSESEEGSEASSQPESKEEESDGSDH